MYLSNGILGWVWGSFYFAVQPSEKLKSRLRFFYSENSEHSESSEYPECSECPDHSESSG